MNITIGELAASARRKLSATYGAGEGAAMVRLIFHSLKGWNNTQLIINSDLPASPFVIGQINKILDRLEKQEPIQYILGEAYFYGMDLRVTPDVLIPRPETEELVDLIVKENDASDLRILDVGTGSGAIAIALARNLPFSVVSAIDISAEALKVAKQNAENLHAKIRFIHQDIFNFSPPEDSYDIIVSNPPYIDESEKSGMETNVLDYEPHKALFVPDDNPLIFYKRITLIAEQSLRHSGKLYFEINPLHAEQLKSYIMHRGFENVNLINDIHGKCRFISCIWP